MQHHPSMFLNPSDKNDQLMTIDVNVNIWRLNVHLLVNSIHLNDQLLLKLIWRFQAINFG